jgi:fructokinase
MIIVAGEALIDLLVHPDGHLTAVPGGGPFNTARTIARLGVETTFLGVLSSDRFGRDLRAALAADGIDLSSAAATDAPTTLAVAELDGEGVAIYRFHAADTSAPALQAAHVDAAFARRPAAIHIGTLGLVLEPMASSLVTGLAALGAGTIVMVDPNCRPTVIHDRSAYLARLGDVVARADIVKVSVDDLAYLAPGESPAAVAHALLERGPRVVLVTDGAAPVAVVNAAGTFEVPVPRVPIIDTIGAGDAFGGAFLARWVERGSGRSGLGDVTALRDAVALAIEVSVRTCQRAGADPPHRLELDWPAP